MAVKRPWRRSEGQSQLENSRHGILLVCTRGVKTARVVALAGMADQTSADPPADLGRELAASLLNCGGVLSQIVSHMVRFEAAGRSLPDTAPIPEVAQALVEEQVGTVLPKYSADQIKLSTALIDEITNEICENIYFVP